MGSLFKLRDFWYTKYGEEEYDMRSMAVGNVDNDPSGAEKVVIGSFQGVLRVLYPQQKGYKPDDLLLEHMLGVPILQVMVGPFLPGGGQSLAILTPRVLIFARVVKRGGGGGGNDDNGGGNNAFNAAYTLDVQFSHNLERTAYCMCNGTFGSKGAQSPLLQVCVLSMDGQLAFFESNQCKFVRYLPVATYLLPGNLEYIPSIDTFCTNTSTFEVEAYKYQTLASSTASETKEMKQGRKLSPDWSFNIGEDVVQMRHVIFERDSPADLVVMCEHTMFLLNAAEGTMKWNRRMDAHPLSMSVYPVGRVHQLLVGTHASNVLVFDSKSVQWSAKAQTVPLVLQTIKAGGVPGMIVMLGDDGSVTVNYLGTDPAINPVAAPESKELDYNAMDEEHRRLQAQIKQVVSNGRQEPTATLQLTADPPLAVSPQRTTLITFHLEYHGGDDLEQVVLVINTPDPITCDQHTHVIPYLGHGDIVDVPVTFSISPEMARFTPTSLLVDAVACYSAPSNGEPLTAKVSRMLPLALVGHPIPPVKNNTNFIQFEINRQAPQLTTLFEDLAQRSGDVGVNVLTLQYPNGHDATVLASKTTNRLRVQGGNFDALWLLASELVGRIKAFFRNEGGEPLQIVVDEIPLKEYFGVIEEHFKVRQHLAQMNQVLAERAQEFRSIQRRLLVRFRERNPAPIASIETLFGITYQALRADGDNVETAMNTLDIHNNALTCATHLVLLLARYKFQETMSAEDFDAFRHYLSPVVLNSPGQGWEETTDAALTHLLRTALAKNAKETAMMPQPMQVAPDTSKLLKHLTLVFARLGQMNVKIVDTQQQQQQQQQQQ